MVTRILDAATQVLASHGYAQMSTNRVAQVAGVSVGSLYRYFGDKEELFEELRLRATGEIVDELTAAMAAAATRPVHEGIREVLATLVASLRRRAPLVGALVNEVPLGTHANVLPEVERGLGQFARLYVAQHVPDLPPEELEARLYLALGITLSSCLRIALEKPEHLDDDHLIDLVAGMLALGVSP